MGYRTVFDVTQVGFQWWIPLLIFVFALIFVGVGWALRSSGDQNSSQKGVLFQGGGLIGILAAGAFLLSMYTEYHSAEKALSRDDCSIAEGVVRDFIPMPPGGHSTESFRINGVLFAYGSGWGSTVFNSEWNTGFIHDGVHARITYRGRDILKVEVK